MFLVRVKYRYNRLFPTLFPFVVGVLLFIVVLFFYTDRLMLLYILFEFSLVPTVYLVLKWGYQPERLQAGLYFVIYTICGSLPLLFVILCLYNFSHTFFIFINFPFYLYYPSCGSYLFLFSLLFAFLVKVPMWGVHLWLPKAHVEAPVRGSMVLAGVLLKLGGYGLLVVYPLCISFYSVFMRFLLGVNLWGVVVVGLVCLCRVDIKGLVAYSSVIHMGVVVIGIFRGTTVGYMGAVLIMVAHGFRSPGMFSLINFNYEVTGSRNLSLQKGVGLLYPVVSLFWFLLVAANMSAPPSLNLFAELLACVSILKLGFFLFLMVFFVTFLSASYNLYLYSCQQGDPLGFIGFSRGVDSGFMLSSLMHVLPVYLGFFSLFYFSL